MAIRDTRDTETRRSAVSSVETGADEPGSPSGGSATERRRALLLAGGYSQQTALLRPAGTPAAAVGGQREASVDLEGRAEMTSAPEIGEETTTPVDPELVAFLAKGVFGP